MYHLSEQEIVREEKRKKLLQTPYNPYPAKGCTSSHTAELIKKDFTEEKKESFSDVSLSGRIISINDRGKVHFIKIQDATGILQLYVKKDDITTPEDVSLWEEMVLLLDMGDIITANGFVFTTRTGEISLHVKKIALLCKSLKPLPVIKRDEQGNVFDEVTDLEFKYRQRYADLIIHPEAKKVFIQRTKIIQFIRDFLNKQGALEVETPVLQNIPGGASAKPFITHHNALDTQLYLRIADELYLKRLIVAGFDAVYEFSKDFRNEGMDRTHNPEFTMLEWYTAYKDYYWMMEKTEQLIEQLTLHLYGKTTITIGEHEIDFKAPFPRISLYDCIDQELTKIVKDGKNTLPFYTKKIATWTQEELTDFCEKEINIPKKSLLTLGKGKLLDHVFSHLCEKKLIQPVFIMDYPIEMSPLAKNHRSKEGLVERFELMVNGQEIANAYSELNDPVEQLERLKEQMKLLEKGDEEAMTIDYDFIRALRYGMPPTAGIGIGIDRLCMLMTQQSSIQDVLFFPHLKTEKW